MKKRNTRLRILDLPEDCLYEITNFFESRNDFLSFILTSKVFYNLSKSKNFFGFSNVIFKVITKALLSNDHYFVHVLSLDQSLTLKDSMKYIKCFPRLTKLFVRSSVDLLVSNDFFEELKCLKVLEFVLCKYEEKDNSKETTVDKSLHLEKLKKIERLSILDRRFRQINTKEEIFSFSGASIVNRTLKDLTLVISYFQNYNFLKELSSLLKLKIVCFQKEFVVLGKTVLGVTDSYFVNFTNLEELIIIFPQPTNELTNDMFKNMKKLKVLKLLHTSYVTLINNKFNLCLLEHLPKLNSLFYMRILFHDFSENEKKLLQRVPNVVLCQCGNKNAIPFNNYTTNKCYNIDFHHNNFQRNSDFFHYFCPSCCCCSSCLEKFECTQNIIKCEGNCKKKLCNKCIVSICFKCCDHNEGSFFFDRTVCKECLKTKIFRNMKGFKCMKECDVCLKNDCINDKESSIKVCSHCESTKCIGCCGFFSCLDCKKLFCDLCINEKKCKGYSVKENMSKEFSPSYCTHQKLKKLEINSI